MQTGEEGFLVELRGPERTPSKRLSKLLLRGSVVKLEPDLVLGSVNGLCLKDYIYGKFIRINVKHQFNLY